jgi:hypothetical protein
MAWLQESFDTARQIRAKEEGRRKSGSRNAIIATPTPMRYTNAHSREVRKSFVSTLRRGEEDLELSTRLGRGERIMRHVMNLNAGKFEKTSWERQPSVGRQSLHSGTKKVVVAPPKYGSRLLSAPPIRRHTQARAMEAMQRNNEASIAIDRRSVDPPAGDWQPPTSPTSEMGHREKESEIETMAELDEEKSIELDLLLLEDHALLSPQMPKRVHVEYDMREAATSVQLPAKPAELRLSGPNSKRFRQAMMDEQTEQQYRLDCARDATKGNQKYSCMICLMNHKLSKRRHDPHEQRALCQH